MENPTYNIGTTIFKQKVLGGDPKDATVRRMLL